MKQIIEQFGLGKILIYFFAINLIGFLAMGLDKWKAKNDRWRIPEDTLILITALGGGIGTIIGMHVFRHKTKKPKFTIGMPAILILEIILIVYLMVK